MPEYIEREAALSAQNKSMNLSECRKRLERIPAADVRPVVHATWETDTCHFYCSECEHYVDYKTNFCPNCGADLRPTSMSGAKGEES